MMINKIKEFEDDYSTTSNYITASITERTQEKCIMIRITQYDETLKNKDCTNIFFNSETLDNLIMELMKLNNEIKYKS